MTTAIRRYAGAIWQRIRARLPRSVNDRLIALALRLTMVSAASAVTRPLTFALRELLPWPAVGEYRLRRSGRTLFVRHPASDAWVVHEVLGRRVYLPPPEVERALQACGDSPRIVDLGAHVGSSTLLLLERFPRARVLALEPNPDTAALLRRMIAANNLTQCELREVAAGTEPGSTMIEGFSLLSHVAREGSEEAIDQLPYLRQFQRRSGAPARVEVVDVLPLLEGADLVKMDIEGAEWPILADPRFARLGIAALVLEYHPQGAPQEDTTVLVRTLLTQAGFTVGEPFDEHDRVGLVWAWRTPQPAS